MDQTSERIACSLSSGEAQERARQWAALLDRAQAMRKPIAGGVRVELRQHHGVAAELDRLLAAERACCPFLTMRVESAGDLLALTVTAPAEAEPLIADFFGALGIRRSRPASAGQDVPREERAHAQQRKPHR